MKRSPILQCLMGALLAFSFSVSAVGQFVTGLELGEDVGGLIPMCAAFSALCSLLFYFRFGWCAVLLLSAGGGYWLYSSTDAIDQFSSFLRNLSLGYYKSYGASILGHKMTDEYELVLLSIAFLTAAAVSFCICRRKRLWTAIAAALFPLASLLPVKSFQPDALYVYMTLAGITVLLITNHARRKDPAGFFPLALRTGAAAAAALALLFWLNPVKDYAFRAEELREKATGVFDRIESSVGDKLPGTSPSQTVDLRYLSSGSGYTYTVMRVSSDFDGPLYLRGRSYDTYDGISWTSSKGRRDVFNKGSSVVGTVTVTVNRASDTLFFPYYPSKILYLTDGFLHNANGQKEYKLTVTSKPVGLNGYVAANRELPDATREWASALVAEITDPDMSTSEKAESIKNYVRNSAVYDLSTPTMGNRGDDFAKWFLYESETGYCAHFASAATVLLRAAGISARYVEGYYVKCIAGQEVTVDNHRAHAWAEYYDSRARVWRVLEATPADALEWTFTPDDDPPQPEPPETEPPETEAPPIITEPPQNPDDTSNDGENTEAPDTETDVGDNGGEKEPQKAFRIPESIKRLFRAALFVFLVPIQASIRIRAKRRRWNKKTPNETALARFRQCELSARMAGITIPHGLEAIALKARFSQHTVSEQELAEFEAFRTELISKINEMPLPKRLYLRWVYAIG